MLKATVAADTSFFCAFVIVTYMPVDPSFPVEHHITKKDNLARIGGTFHFRKIRRRSRSAVCTQASDDDAAFQGSIPLSGAKAQQPILGG
jgi:hypothetical protein